MKGLMIIGTIILLNVNLIPAFTQELDYMGKMDQIFKVEHEDPHYMDYIHESGNPLEFIFSALFVGYKTFLSSQDMGACVFHPSCSEYGIQAIQKRGILTGMIDTFDRLTRCHPFPGGKYQFDQEKMKYYDPVD
jgi:putative membrane protein insertion efficiency factor